MMISFDVSENNRFHFRAGSIIQHRGRTLFQRPADSDKWFLPGGRVEFGETAEETVKREMIEEFAVEVKACQLVWVVESFLKIDERNYQELAFYYIVTLPDDHPLLDREGEFTGAEDGYFNKWMTPDELDQSRIVPGFVTERLRELPNVTVVTHFVDRP